MRRTNTGEGNERETTANRDGAEKNRRKADWRNSGNRVGLI